MDILDKNTEVPEEVLLTHLLKDYFDQLALFNSTRKLKRSFIYKALKEEIERVVNGIEYGAYAEKRAYEKRPFYRAVAWNVERGVKFEGLLHFLKHHSEISRADLLFLSETDIGMARTQNRNIAREFALELGMNYFFAPSYLNLCKGNSIEGHFDGNNELGLHGNALLSRYPLENLRIVSLKNCKDKMRGSEKRMGCQKALIAEVVFPFRKMTAVVAHLDAHSSQRQRAQQMLTILDVLKDNRYPVLIGGDLNTSCYNARKAIFAFFGFWNKVFRGPSYVIREHHPYPDRYFDRRLFDVLKNHEMDYKNFNETGVGSLHYSVEDIKRSHLVREVVPEWCGRVMENTLNRAGGKVSLKLDWFAARWLKPAELALGASPPKVIQDLRYQDEEVSDHAPILVDIDIYG